MMPVPLLKEMLQLGFGKSGISKLLVFQGRRYRLAQLANICAHIFEVLSLNLIF
jgi:hypothetical protein